MSKIDYQALREIAKQATQGEWVAFISSGTGTYAVHTPGDKRCEDVIKWPGFDGQKNAENNARYIAAFNPEVVQALLDEREAKDKAWSAQDNHINQQADRIESLEKKNGELGRTLEAAEKRIAELEAREISLPERSSMLHRTDFHDDYQTVMAHKVSEVIDAIRAAGIRIKGE
ncbi:ead/Ea22-like family protein [Escherichia coli]|nr:ead/Ea22-like family protein [Escherichia coli]EFB4636288.1 ead/Ea22-like family protein [Escherichia coli]EFM2442268.1 ead/Ea22-like family protein [Escherichia coli]EHC2659527.1 ead/Ea22-like family protein [Escherichia coli]EJH9374142.1 ead/Ea22-like family protein [Escherichia coli]